MIVSLIGTVLPAIIFAYAQNYINSASAGMLNSLTPIFTFLLGLIIYKNRWSNKSLIGIIIGLAGSYILLLPTNTHILQTKYSLLIILATLFYALSINTIKEKLYSLKPLDIAVISSFISFIIPVIFILNNDLSYSLNKINHNFTPFIYIIILGGICTSLAIVLFNYLIQKTSALFGSSTTYLIPVFAILWGTIDNEIINTHEIIGVIIILSGVFIMNYKKID
ncbi:MAG: hypothetical protein CMP49_04300 [Flavobacteriales bacterium]|nr:hypothetical protein [Flavobacteriales bacterium]